MFTWTPYSPLYHSLSILPSLSLSTASKLHLPSLMHHAHTSRTPPRWRLPPRTFPSSPSDIKGASFAWKIRSNAPLPTSWFQYSWIKFSVCQNKHGKSFFLKPKSLYLIFLLTEAGRSNFSSLSVANRARHTSRCSPSLSFCVNEARHSSRHSLSLFTNGSGAK